MKKRTISLLAAILIFGGILAQSPEAFKYQAIARSSNGDPLVNQNISIRVQIIEGSLYGASVYVETHQATTNNYGLINLSIGMGNAELGSFASIQWGKNEYYIEIAIDANGGSNYIQMGIAQLLSVPYALYAKTSEGISGGIRESDPIFNASVAKTITKNDTSNWNNKLDFEIDGSNTNELQVLSISNDTVFLSKGGFVVLPPSYDPLPFNGSTLLTKDQQFMLNNWVGNPNQKWTLCYTKSIDGATSKIFNDSCKYKGPSVSLIRLYNGRTFGGFTENSWSPDYGYLCYQKTFLFSIDNKKKYPLGAISTNTPYTIYSSYGSGPTFGIGFDLYVNNNMDLAYVNFPNSFCWNGLNRSPSNQACQELCGLNLSTFSSIIELEVWVME